MSKQNEQLEESFAEANQEIELGTIINKVKAALIDVSEHPDMGAGLKTVELTLKTVAYKEITPGLKFKFLIVDVELGAKISGEHVQTVSLTIVPPKPTARMKVKLTPDIRESLVAGILAIREGISVAAMKPRPLQLKDAYVELNFTVTKEGKFDLVLIGGQLSAQSVQTIKVTFSSPESDEE